MSESGIEMFVNILTYLLQLKFLSYEELQQRMANLDAEMEREIDELRRRYQTKRQPILDAMDQKRKRQQNF
jgi:serine/threonine kinase 3